AAAATPPGSRPAGASTKPAPSPSGCRSRHTLPPPVHPAPRSSRSPRAPEEFPAVLMRSSPRSGEAGWTTAITHLLPQLESLESDRRTLGISTPVDGAVQGPNGIQADLNGVLGGKLYPSDGEPFLAVCATEGGHAGTQPFEAQKYSIGGQ